MKIRDNFGWPIEVVEGRWFSNFMRRLIHINLWQTWSLRNHD